MPPKAKTRRLTDEQRATVEENLALVNQLITLKFHREPRRDVFQDGVIGLCNAISCPTYIANGKSSYMARSVINMIMKGLLKRNKTLHREQPIDPQVTAELVAERGTTDPTEGIERQEELDAVHRAIATAGLNPRQKRLLHLRYVRGYNQRRIARDWKVSYQMIQQIEGWALVKIRKALHIVEDSA